MYLQVEYLKKVPHTPSLRRQSARPSIAASVVAIVPPLHLVVCPHNEKIVPVPLTHYQSFAKLKHINDFNHGRRPVPWHPLRQLRKPPLLGWVR